MEPWKSSLGIAAAVSAAVQAQAQAPLIIVAEYDGRKPAGQTEIDVQVGDVVHITVEGPDKTTGRKMTYKANSNYDEYEKKGCRKKKKVQDMPRDGTFNTPAILFKDYMPAVAIPGAGNSPLAIKERNLTYVVKEAGKLRITELVIVDPETVYLDGPAPAPNAREQEALTGERKRREAAGHYNITISETIHPGAVKFSVKVRIERK